MAEEEQAPAKKKSKLLIIIVAVLALLIVALAGVGYFLYSHSQPSQAEEHAKAQEENVVPKPVPAPIYYPMESLIVNVAGKGDITGILQISFDLQIREEGMTAKIDAYRPKIVSSLIFLISSTPIEELRSAQGKTKLQAQIRQVANETLLDAGLDAPVIGVAFTSFIIQ